MHEPERLTPQDAAVQVPGIWNWVLGPILDPSPSDLVAPAPGGRRKTRERTTSLPDGDYTYSLIVSSYAPVSPGW